jgi:hypothetical protein
MSPITSTGETTNRLVYWSGIAGLVGATIMLVGDMLFYGRADSSIDHITMMGMVPLWRLYLGGLLGIVAGVFYMLGTAQVYLATRSAGRSAALITGGAFFVMMVFNGAYHTTFPAWGLAAQLATNYAGAGATALAQAEEYLRWLRLFGVVPQLLFTLAFAFVVITGKTAYPRWMAPITPLVLLLALPFITGQLSGLLFVVLQGGIANIVFIVFFAIATAALWLRNRQVAAKPAIPTRDFAETS